MSGDSSESNFSELMNVIYAPIPAAKDNAAVMISIRASIITS